ncbi:MAG: hypothetical protein WC882_00500 [Candidatus Gracilibacteria bacterium]
MDYGIDALMEEQGLTQFQDCTTFVGDKDYGYSNEVFDATFVYGNCAPDEYRAYLLIDHDFELMDVTQTTVEYTTQNYDTVVLDAVRFSFDFWYNPVDIEVSVVPFSGNTVLGIHEFRILCMDDDDSWCPVEYIRSATAEDLEGTLSGRGGRGLTRFRLPCAENSALE